MWTRADSGRKATGANASGIGAKGIQSLWRADFQALQMRFVRVGFALDSGLSQSALQPAHRSIRRIRSGLHREVVDFIRSSGCKRYTIT